MNKILYRRFAGLFCLIVFCIVATRVVQAQDLPKPAGQKDGINLYIRFVEPLDRQNPKILCTLENTTDKPVPFQLQGAADGYGFGLHLIDENGRELEKTAEWLRLYETGSNIHTRYGALRPDILFGPIEMELEKAYGSKWAFGVRLDIEWNSREPRRGPGPFGGQFGIGSGLSGSIDLFPLTGKKLIPPPEPQDSNTVENPAGEQPASDDDAPVLPKPNEAVQEKPVKHEPSTQVTNGFALNGTTWAWIIGAVIVLLAGAFWLGVKSSSRPR